MINHSSFQKMPGNYAKVYLYICSRMNFRTFISKVSVRKISEKTGCSQTTIIQALRFLEDLGAIKITRHGCRASEIEIVKHFCTAAPVECSSATEHKAKKQIRSVSGRFAPSPRKTTAPVSRNAERSSATESLQNLSSQRSFIQIPPISPQGDVRPSENLGRTILSKETIKEFISIRGEAWTRQYLLDRGYPLSEGIFATPKKADSPTDGGNNDNPGDIQGEPMDPLSESKDVS